MKKFIWVLLLASLVLISCGSGISGTYSDESGVSSYTFKSGGVVAVSAMGIEIEQKYKVEGGKVKIISADSTLVLKIVNDTTIEGPMGIVLTKKK